MHTRTYVRMYQYVCAKYAWMYVCIAQNFVEGNFRLILNSQIFDGMDGKRLALNTSNFFKSYKKFNGFNVECLVKNHPTIQISPCKNFAQNSMYGWMDGCMYVQYMCVCIHYTLTSNTTITHTLKRSETTAIDFAIQVHTRTCTVAINHTMNDIVKY